MGFQAIGFDDFAKELDRLGKLDEYAPDMLETAAPLLERELKGQVQAEANRGYATGDLAGSIKSRKPEKNERGHYVTITASGKDKKGVRRNEKLAYLNYGTTKQQARPVISKAVQNAEGECLEAMQRKFDEVTGP